VQRHERFERVGHHDVAQGVATAQGPVLGTGTGPDNIALEQLEVLAGAFAVLGAALEALRVAEEHRQVPNDIVRFSGCVTPSKGASAKARAFIVYRSSRLPVSCASNVAPAERWVRRWRIYSLMRPSFASSIDWIARAPTYAGRAGSFRCRAGQ
jgi:hypothetical protein